MRATLSHGSESTGFRGGLRPQTSRKRKQLAMTATNTNLHHQLKEQLLSLHPRAFELVAGDLLTCIGLQDVRLTRYVGDEGIDASGTLVTGEGLVRIPTGVQVKRHRQNVQRVDIDRFIGALGGRFSHGLFITTAGYARQAREKAQSSPLIRIDTIDGDRVIALMQRHHLGVTTDQQLDTSYFVNFEAQVGRQLHEQREVYTTDSTPIAIPPEQDLISLQALSYALRVDPTTIRAWVERERLIPDQRQGFLFRRDRLEAIRRDLGRPNIPVHGGEWRQEFLNFAKNRHLTRSYKPVLLKLLLKLVNSRGEVALNDLVAAFHAFYIEREQLGLPTEFGTELLARPAQADPAAVRRLLVRYPLDRFLIQGFLELIGDGATVRFKPELWAELRAYELVDLLAVTDEQLRYYYERRASA